MDTRPDGEESQSKEPPSHPQEDGYTMVVEPRQRSPHLPEDHRPMVNVELREPLSNPQEDDTGVESREKSLALESLVKETFERRRSSRKIDTKNKPRANFVAASKSSSGKKKPTFEKEDILPQASLSTFPSNKGE